MGRLQFLLSETEGELAVVACFLPPALLCCLRAGLELPVAWPSSPCWEQGVQEAGWLCADTLCSGPEALPS